MLYILSSVLLSMSISLGVGSSTLAILNFFRALSDGKIDESERHMMGIVYIVLRVAMGLIVFSAAISGVILLNQFGHLYFSAPIVQIMWTLIGILFLNAWLMTKHVVPSSIGPSLQATTWYSLGILMSLESLDLDQGVTFWQFSLGYLLLLLITTIIVNGYLTYVKHKNTPAKKA